MIEKQIEKTHTELTLLQNAYNFIHESMKQYVKAQKNSNNWPFAILLIIQGLELLMKQVLKNEHPMFIYENIDKPKNTVSLAQALDRLTSISNVKLDEKENRLIKKSINYRNQIVHYEISFNNQEFKVIYSQLFELVHYFHKRHLKRDLHDIMPDNLWKTEADLMTFFKKRIVFYNGIEVDKSTPKSIVEYQKFDGFLYQDKLYDRIKYGDEINDRVSDTCHDCGCLKGQFHTDGCDVEDCPVCGEQFLGCSCGIDEGDELLYVRLKDYQKNNKA